MPAVAPILSSRIVTLDAPIQYLKGIGPKRAEQLLAQGIGTVAKLLEYAPFRYEDRAQFRPICSVRADEPVLIRGEICGVSEVETLRRRMSIFEMLVKDSTGTVALKFFNQPYLRQVYRAGLRIVIYGQAKRDSHSGGALCFVNPECEILEDEAGVPVHTGRVVPVYRKLGDMRTRRLRAIMFSLISNLPADLSDPLPGYLQRRLRLPARSKALAQVHFPELRATAPEKRANEMELLNLRLSTAHKRLIFEELFQLQVGIRMVRESRIKLTKKRTLRLGENVRLALKRVLPFHPTGAQKRVLREIADDMRSSRPMSRLLQGDVGSGKTIVAAEAAVIAVENGFQVAIMAPTEILAEQHFFNFRKLLAPLGYPIDFIKGGMGAKDKRDARERIRSGESRIAIGTHALIQEGVEFLNLALVVVDEQHRFGVVQRNTLKGKGDLPDMLVMTATPIPRSLALTLYGDLDVSVIDEMPPGRKPIETRLCDPKDRRVAYQEVRRAVAERHQVYIVCPLVEESEKTDLRAATELAGQLRTKIFPDLQIGLLHGRMKSVEKEGVMKAFSSGELQILVSTTVIEVGVDVANATLMVIEHAERFGLAQLHQLRGRVGRGAVKSLCILIGDVRRNAEARRRLEIMSETNDGFRIAEVDLELRGPGEIAGTRQSGVPAFKWANLVRDRKALEIAREEADRFVKLLRAQPDEESRRIEALIRHQWQDRYRLALVG